MKNIYLQVRLERPASEQPHRAFDWWTLLPAILAALVVAVGWAVVERFARRREKRSDVRAAAVTFGAAIDEVLTVSAEFYALAGNDPRSYTMAATIKTKFQLLAEYLTILSDSGLKIESEELLKRFRQSVTGGDFDSQSRPASPQPSLAFMKMTADGQTLKHTVQQGTLRMLLPKGRRA